MRAILIDVYERSVGEAEFDGTIEGMHGLLRCGIAQPIRWPDHALWIDEEGALKAGVPAFILQGFSQPLAGNGLVCGSTRGGKLADVTATVEQVFDMITFSDLVTTGKFTEATTKEGTPPFSFVIDMGKPLFTTRTGEDK